jgi:hypothetical protein
VPQRVRYKEEQEIARHVTATSPQAAGAEAGGKYDLGALYKDVPAGAPVVEPEMAGEETSCLLAVRATKPGGILNGE